MRFTPILQNIPGRWPYVASLIAQKAWSVQSSKAL